MFEESSDDENDNVESSPSLALLLSRRQVPGAQVGLAGKRSWSIDKSRKTLKEAGSPRARKKRRCLDDDEDEDPEHSSTIPGEEAATVADVSAFYMSVAQVEELEEFKQAKNEEAVRTIISQLAGISVHDSIALQTFESTLNKISATTSGGQSERLSTRDRLMSEAWRRMALFCQDRHCHPKALMYYLKVLELDENDLSGWQTVYRLAYDLHRYDLCADACKHACRVASSARSGEIDAVAVEYLILIYYAVFNYEKCMSLAWDVVHRDPFSLIGRVIAEQLQQDDKSFSYKYGFQWDQLCVQHPVEAAVLNGFSVTIMQQCKSIRQHYFDLKSGHEKNSMENEIREVSVFGTLRIECPSSAKLSRASSLIDVGNFLLQVEKLISPTNYADRITITNAFQPCSGEVVFNSTVTDASILPCVVITEYELSAGLQLPNSDAGTDPSDNKSSNDMGSTALDAAAIERRQSARRYSIIQATNETLNAFRRLFLRLEPPAAWLEEVEVVENESAEPQDLKLPSAAHCNSNLLCETLELSENDSLRAAQRVLHRECVIDETERNVTFTWHRTLQTFCMACADVADRQWPEELVQIYTKLYISLRRTYRMPDVDRLSDDFLLDDAENVDDHEKSADGRKRNFYVENCRLVLSVNEMLVDSLLKWKQQAWKSLPPFEFYQQKILRTFDFGTFFTEDMKFLEQLCVLNAAQLFGMPNAAEEFVYKLEQESKLGGWRLFVRIMHLSARHAEYFECQSIEDDDDSDKLKADALMNIEKFLHGALEILNSVHKRMENFDVVAHDQYCSVVLANCIQEPFGTPLVISAQFLRAELELLHAKQLKLIMSSAWRNENYSLYVQLFCQRYGLADVSSACDVKFLARKDDAACWMSQDIWRLVESLSLLGKETRQSSYVLIQLLEAWLHVYVTSKLDAVDAAYAGDADKTDAQDSTCDNDAAFAQWTSDVFRIFHLLHEHIDVRQENLYPHEALERALASDGQIVSERILRRLARSVYNALLAIFSRTSDGSVMPITITTSLILLATVFRILPDASNPLQAQQNQAVVDAENEKNENAPIFCQFLYYSHAFLAGGSTLRSCSCTINGGQFLAFSIETLRLFVKEINTILLSSKDTEHSPTKLHHITHICDEAVDELDQAFYCLFHCRRLKKSRFDEHSDTGKVDLNLATCYDLYEHFLPASLPIPDGHRQETLSTDQKDTFISILEVLNATGFDAEKESQATAYLLKPSELRQVETGMLAEYTEIAESYAAQTEQLERNYGKRSPVRRSAKVAENLYYCLADWHSKTEWYDQAYQYYRIDLRRNPQRAESWVGLAMTARAMGGNDMKTTEFSFTSLNEYDKCEEALNYFRIALLRFGVGHEELMWIEMGLMAYEMQTCLSWRVKMAKEIEADRIAVIRENECDAPSGEPENAVLRLEGEDAARVPPALHNISICSIEDDAEITEVEDTKSAINYLVSPLLPDIAGLERYMMYSGMALPADHYILNFENKALIGDSALAPLDVNDGDEALQKRCLKRRRQLLLVCLYAFVQAEHCNAEPNEHWLHHYMMGKCCEKLRPREPERYLLQYAFSLEALDKIQKCVYPTQTTWSNWNKLGPDMNAIELYYRVHASALKFLTLYAAAEHTSPTSADAARFDESPPTSEQIKFLRCMLDDLSQCPFIVNTSGGGNKPAAVTTAAVAPPTSATGGRKRREAPQTSSYTAEQWAVHTQLLAAKCLSHVRNEGKEDDPEAMSENADLRRKLIDKCLHGIHIVLERCPWHYKALNRLAVLYAEYKSMINEDKVRALLVGGVGSPRAASSSATANSAQIANWKPPRGLFQDRKPTNYFNGVWQLPDDEIQRCFTFSNHLYRAASMLMRVLRRDGESQMLLQMALQFGRPNSKHSYLRDADYVTLSQRACRMTFATLDEQVAVYAVDCSSSSASAIAPDQRAAFVRNVWKCYKTLKDSKLKIPKLAQNVLVDVFERIERPQPPQVTDGLRTTPEMTIEKRDELKKEHYGSASIKAAQRYFNTTFGNPNQTAKSRKLTASGEIIGSTVVGDEREKFRRMASISVIAEHRLENTDSLQEDDFDNLPTGVAGLEMLTQSTSAALPTTSKAVNGGGGMLSRRRRRMGQNSSLPASGNASAAPSPLVAGQHVLSPGDIADLEQLLDSSDMSEFLK